MDVASWVTGDPQSSNRAPDITNAIWLRLVGITPGMPASDLNDDGANPSARLSVVRDQHALAGQNDSVVERLGFVDTRC